MRQQEKTQRTRAFFCAAAAIAANAYGLEDMEMFENGMGAVNLPLMAGTFGAPFSKHNTPMAISTSESAAMGSEVVP